METNLKTTRYIMTIALPLLIFLLLTENVINSDIQWFDNYVYSIVSRIISEKLTPVMVFITFLASGKFLSAIAVLLIISIFIKKQYSFYSSLIVFNISLSSLINLGLKNLINRTRPDILKLIEVTGLSFPSGHSMAAMSFYGFLIYLCGNYYKGKYKKTLIGFLCLIIISVGFSRVYLGVHYVSDVLGGFSFGLLWIGILSVIIDKYKVKYV